MSKGRKTGGRDWGPNCPPPKSPGCPPLSKEARALRKLTTGEFILRVNKYLYMTKAQLLLGIENPKIEVLDLYIRNSLVKGIERGDYGQLDKILDRVIGKVKQDVTLTGFVARDLESLEGISNEELDVRIKKFSERIQGITE